MTWEEITEDVDTGKKVYWSNAGYVVIKKDGGYYIKYLHNGLAFQIYKETFHNQDAEQFFM